MMVMQMNNLLITVLSLSLSGSILIATLLLCKPFYRERLSKRWHYYIWLIVVVRLLLPFSFEVNLIGSLFEGFNQTGITAWQTGESNTVSDEAVNNFIGDSDSQVILPIPSDTQNIFSYSQAYLPETQTATPYQQNNLWSAILPNIWLAWLVVALLLFVRKVTIYQSFSRYIKAGRVELSNIGDLERFGKIVEESNIRGMVGIYTHSLISSPLLIGFFRPYIVLPTLDISESDFRYTVLHELTHYKRGDMFYKWLVQLTICLHWFNPLVYLMGREIEDTCELSCDEAVIRNLDYHEIRAYGNTLLNALNIGGEYRNSISSVTLSENKKILEERLNMIKKFKKKSRFAVMVAICATVFLSIGAGVVGVYGMGSPAVISTQTTVNDDMSTINSDFSFEIPVVAAGEVALIGRVFLSYDNPITVVVSDYTSEYGFFLALNDSSTIQTINGTRWNRFTACQSVNNGRFTFTSDHERVAYLYIGNGRGTIGLRNADVTFNYGSNVGNARV